MFRKNLRICVFAFSAVSALILASVTASVLKAADAAEPTLAQYQAEAKAIAANLATFDKLDYEVFTGQQWAKLHESHSKDVIVNWPDGHQTKGIKKHIEDLKAMFVYAPDTRIKVHTVKIGSGEWTAVIGIMEGTFTKPMPDGTGKFIQPTGKPYKITMCTVGHWKNGVMIEEYLFWDNLTYMKQLGLM
jgi:predicted ester cyclase